MTDEERAALRYKLLRERLVEESAKFPEEVTNTAPGGAFLGDMQNPNPDVVPPLFEKPKEVGAAGQVLRAIPSLYAGGKAARKGEEAGVAAGEALGLPWPVPQVLGGASAVVAGGTAATAAHMALEETKRRLGLQGADSDSMSESLAHSLGMGSDVALGETWSQVADPLMRGFTIPSKVQLSPDEMAAMTEMQARLKGVYQNITGHDPVPAWNPFRKNQSWEDDVDATADAAKLRAAGLDPREARFIALGNPRVISEASDSRLGQLLQQTANNSMFGQNAMEKFRGTREKMMQMAANDLGDRFGQLIPTEQLGKAVFDAVDGRFRPLLAARREAVQAIAGSLPPGTTFNGAFLRQGYSSLTKDANSLIGSLPDAPTFNQIQDVREKLSVLAHDMSNKTPAGDAARAQALTAAQELDKRMLGQLPVGQRKNYLKYGTADMDLKEGQFNSSFVQGLLNSKQASFQYATKILNDGNAENFLKLEKAAGPEVANNVRRAIWQKVVDGATDAGGELVGPDRLNRQLNGQGKLGRAFLETVMGKDTVDSYGKLANAYQLLQKRMQETGNIRWAGTDAWASRLGLSGAIGGYLGHGVYGKAADIVAGLFAPPVIAKIMTNPRAADLAEKLVTGAANRVGPGKLSRLASYTLEALGDSPENIIAQSGAPGTMGLAQTRKDLEEGKLPWYKRAGSAALEYGKEAVSTPMGWGSTPGQVH